MMGENNNPNNFDDSNENQGYNYSGGNDQSNNSATENHSSRENNSNSESDQYGEYSKENFQDNLMNAMDYTKTDTNETYGQSFDSSSVTETKAKKPNGKFIALFILLAIIIAGSAAAYANRNALSNTYALMTKSPLEYYNYVETKGVNGAIDAYTAYYSEALTEYKLQKDTGIASDVNVKLTIDPQFTSLIGLSDFESLEAQIHSQSKGMNKGKSDIALSYNGQSLLTLNTLINNETSDIYLKVPELSSAYLLLSMDEIMQTYDPEAYGGSYSNYMKKVEELINSDTLSPETINSLLKKYTSLIINNIDDVQLEKNVEVTASDISNSYTKLTASLTGEDAYNMALALLNEAKSDETLKALFVSTSLYTEEEYASGIDSAVEELNAEKDSMLTSEDSVLMNVYVNKNGSIMGREFVINSEAGTNNLGYSITNKGSDIGFSAWLKSDDTNVIDLSGKGTYSSDGFNGSAVFTYSMYNDLYGDYSTYTFNLTMENAKMEAAKGYISGKFSLTSDSLMGAEIDLDCTADEGQQKYLLTVLYGNLDAATLDITASKGTYEDFEYPASEDEVYDAYEEFDSYMATMDVEGFTSRFQSVTGIDLNSLISSLLFGGLY